MHMHASTKIGLMTLYSVGVIYNSHLLNKTNKDGCQNLKEWRVRLKFYYVFKEILNVKKIFKERLGSSGYFTFIHGEYEHIVIMKIKNKRGIAM